MKAFRFHATGGPEVLRLEGVVLGAPGPGQVLMRNEAVQVKPGDTILVHAAAGGVGLIMCQWAKHLGATVIGTVGSAAKAEIARQHGCDHPIPHGEDFVARVRALTGGKGVPVVYDSI